MLVLLAICVEHGGASRTISAVPDSPIQGGHEVAEDGIRVMQARKHTDDIAARIGVALVQDGA